MSSWIVVWMICANLAALGETARVLNAAALAVIFCLAETLLVPVHRVREEGNDQANKSYHDGHDVFQGAHFVART